MYIQATKIKNGENVGKNIEKLDHSYVAGGNVKWRSSPQITCILLCLNYLCHYIYSHILNLIIIIRFSMCEYM